MAISRAIHQLCAGFDRRLHQDRLTPVSRRKRRSYRFMLSLVINHQEDFSASPV